MEDMLRAVVPEAECKHVRIGMFANNLTLHEVGNDIAMLASDLTEITKNHLMPWPSLHDVPLSLKKCHSFLFSRIGMIHGLPSVFTTKSFNP